MEGGSEIKRKYAIWIGGKWVVVIVGVESE
jgi:hypothetical protein